MKWDKKNTCIFWKNYFYFGVSPLGQSINFPIKIKELLYDPNPNIINFDKIAKLSMSLMEFCSYFSNVSLQFYWLKYKLTVDPTNPEGSVIYSKVMAGTPPFCVYPTYGILPPADSLYFETIFAPEKVSILKHWLK